MIELFDLLVILKENEMAVRGKMYPDQHHAQPWCRDEQLIGAPIIYIHFNLFAHFSLSVPIEMKEISFIIDALQMQTSLWRNIDKLRER